MPEDPRSGPDHDADEAASRRASLGDRLRRRIAEAGPITFAEFMEAALYDPEAGFYSGVPVGERGDFVTSPHVSPAFAALLALQTEEIWNGLGSPEPFDIIEVGAADGTFARQLLAALPREVAGATRFTAVERGAGGKRALGLLAGEPGSPGRFDVHADIRSVAGGRTGLVLANEVFDNVPAHRLRGVLTPSGPQVAELLVSHDDAGFVLVETGPAPADLAAAAPNLGPGDEAMVAPAALGLLDDMTGVLDRGYVLVIDYGRGIDGDERPPTRPHAYRAHTVDPDVLAEPGSRDITAGVDVPALIGHAIGRGLTVWGPVAQRQALLALGFRDLDRNVQDDQIAAIRAGRGIDALHAYSARTRANLLLAPEGLGGFIWVCFGVNVPEDMIPRAMRGSDRAGR